VDSYRCYFLGADGRFIGVETLEAPDDDAALVEARRLYAIHAASGDANRYGFEVWQGARLIHSVPET
jgi:hypothetical protein